MGSTFPFPFGTKGVSISLPEHYTENHTPTCPKKQPTVARRIPVWSAAMTLKLQEIDPEKDFPALARCMFESYEDPPQKFFHVFFPIHGSGHEAREAAIQECAERLKLWHTQDPSSYWQKVVDKKTGKITGGALWNIHEENPFANPHPSDVTWFPDDGSRRFVEKALENHSRPRSKMAQKPHLCKYSCLHIRTLPISF